MAELTIEEKINRAKEGRTQLYIVMQMIKKGIVITDVQFTRKKKGISKFTEEELAVLSEILHTKIEY